MISLMPVLKHKLTSSLLPMEGLSGSYLLENPCTGNSSPIHHQGAYCFTERCPDSDESPGGLNTKGHLLLAGGKKGMLLTLELAVSLIWGEITEKWE
ncbi:hypothetical protein NC653_010852 [Populus alba x Populus x berolinensis]|uniref:Uncharacterized protein n=1 Tax=Populus alba x Populus x berolinensis TaxID=444605 RepID=A0AAD6W686_9ROSI|nr:hypothetical protein NC653_010852 [Populus alba x Populus x berolinensis]